MTPTEMPELLWQVFASTGSVWAYLIYRRAVETSTPARAPTAAPRAS